MRDIFSTKDYDAPQNCIIVLQVYLFQFNIYEIYTCKYYVVKFCNKYMGEPVFCRKFCVNDREGSIFELTVS